jgi:hypothetical protein
MNYKSSQLTSQPSPPFVIARRSNEPAIKLDVCFEIDSRVRSYAKQRSNLSSLIKLQKSFSKLQQNLFRSRAEQGDCFGDVAVLGLVGI